MIFEHYSKNKKILVPIFVVLLGAGVLLSLYSSVIFQEGNPWPQMVGIAQLTFGDSDMVTLSDSDNVYMTKSGNGTEVIKKFMEEKGHVFTEQMGSAYLFKSPQGDSAVVVHRYYSRFYSLWRITEYKISDIAEGLRECLPKSDMASYEKCRELLSQITDYASCVGAGFSVMKSNPPQCATPDGRTFVQTN